MITITNSKNSQKKLFSGFKTVLYDICSKPSGAIGFSLVLFHVILALISPAIVPYDYKAMDAGSMLSTPSVDHWLGTDHLGRDVLTRVLLGGREAIFVTAVATPIAVMWGGFIGIFFGLIGGRVDEFFMRIVDAFLSLPWILKMLVLIVTFGSSMFVLMPTLAFFYGIPVIRIARDFILSAKARGQKRITIIMRELLPNVLDTLMVEGAMRWSWMLLAFSSLSFLGFGVSPPTPDWGLMISDARGFMSFRPWGVIGPVIALSTLIIGINLTADALAKALGVDRAQKAPV
jgi:peptide/nickel transport system permease protein